MTHILRVGIGIRILHEALIRDSREVHMRSSCRLIQESQLVVAHGSDPARTA